MDAFQSGKHYRHRSKPSSTAPSIVNQAPCSTGLRHVKIPITEAAQLLRGLVQHVLSPAATLALSPRLDCLQALRDKTLYVSVHLMPIVSIFVFVFLLLPSVTVAGEKQCLHYEPAVVKLVGMLFFRTFSD